MRFQQNRCVRRIVRLVRTVIDTYKNTALVGQLCIVTQLFIRSEDILRRVCGNAGRTVDGENFFWSVLTYKTLYRSSLPLISAHVFLRMSSLCQVRADTNLGLKNFLFQSSPLFEIVLLSGCCGGNCFVVGLPRLSIGKRAGALFNPILTGYKKKVQRAASVNWKASTLCRLSGHPVHALPPVRAPRSCSVAHPVRAHMGQNVV